jgi:predicted amidohydrolase YtcJ
MARIAIALVGLLALWLAPAAVAAEMVLVEAESFQDPGGWVPAEKVSVEESVRAYTVNGAWVEFAEAGKGSIAAGKLADLVVLDRDIFAIPPEEIGNVRVRLTVFDGRVIYGKDR